MRFYRKQPIEAEQFTKENELDFIEKYGLELFEYVSIGGGPNIPVDHAGDGCMVYLMETKEGKMHVVVGDWFVKEADEIRVMTDEEFKQQYAELPVIPKAVADWIEKCKHDGTSVGYMLCYERQPEKVRDWIELTPGTYDFNQRRYAEHQDLIARAWLDGYVVEENDEKFDSRVNGFIEDKQVVQITTNETVSDSFDLTHSLTVLYKENRND